MIKIKLIDKDKLSTSEFNVRKTIFEDEDFENLKDSIKSSGIIEPLIVREKKNSFEIIVGQRRFEACKQLKIKEIPCIVKDISDREAIEYSLIENLQRENLDPIDIAEGLKRLVDIYSRDESKTKIVEEILPKQIGMPKQTIWRYLSLVNLTPELKEMISDGKITIESGAKLKEFDEEQQKDFVEEFSKVLEEKPITQNIEEEIVKKVKENPEDIKESIKKVVELNIPEHIIITMKTPDGNANFRMSKRYYTFLSEVAERRKTSPLQLIEDIIKEKLKEWGYKI